MSGGVEPEIIEQRQQKPRYSHHPQESKQDKQKTNKQSLTDYLNQSSDYPRGKRQNVINKMTKIPNQDYMKFKECRNWKEVVQFHRQCTPWLDDTQINEFIKLYKMQAQTLHQKKELPENQLWRLNDV